jgi:hypothetical protein
VAVILGATTGRVTMPFIFGTIPNLTIQQ